MVGWRKAWTWVRSLTEVRRGLSFTSEEEGDIFGGETVTSLWHSRNFLMLNFFYRWNYNIQSYLLLVLTTVDSTFKEQSGAKETKTLCAPRQFALFSDIQSMLGFSKENKAVDFLMQRLSSSFRKKESVFLRDEMSCPRLHSSVVSYLRQSLSLIPGHYPSAVSVCKACLTLLWPHWL